MYICDTIDDEQHLKIFIEQFRYSQMESIDAFLARRPEFAEIGKRVIAAILLDKEDKNLIHAPDDSDGWYRYFFNKITSEKWEELDFSRISIVTFNYDRSLEFYLANAMMASYGQSFQACCDKLNELKIIHVYGMLGGTNPLSADYFPYGEKLNKEKIHIAASKLKVIPEGRQDDENLILARKELASADNIGFLGFGFDQINLQRIDSQSTCSVHNRNSNSRYTFKIIATCFGMTEAEIRKAAKMTRGDGAAGDFYKDTNCLQALRESLLLDDLS